MSSPQTIDTSVKLARPYDSPEEFIRILVSKEKVVTIQQVVDERLDLEKAINALVWNYEKRTGCTVSEVKRKDGEAKTYWVPQVRL